MKAIFKIFFLLTFMVAFAQAENKYIKQGNDLYRQEIYDGAEAHYRQALKENPQNTTAAYNLANALMQQKKWDEAQKIYSQLASGSDAAFKSVAYYNSGVAHTKKKELEESIEAYKNALRINPDDKEARENLQKALSELKKGGGGGGGSQNNKSNMSDSEAENKLQQLQQKEKEAQQRLRKQKGEGSGGGARDW